MGAAGDPWASLETKPVRPGRARKRVRPDSPRDMFVELDLESRRRMFTYRRPWTDQSSLPSWERTQALDCVTRFPRDGSILEISVVLEDATLAGVFTSMAASLAETIVAASNDDAALAELLRRMAQWQRMFESIDLEGLSLAARRGLVGELLILRDDVIPQAGEEDAVEGWTGPLRSNQDFQLSTTALEVKCTGALHPQGFTVNNERELDLAGTGATQLSLIHISLDERRGEGFVLPDLVADVDRALDQHPVTQALFHELLGRVGYLPAQAKLYLEPHYSVRGVRYFDVTEDFPRITEAELRDGVGQVEYRVTLAACAPFELQRDAVLLRIRGEATDA